MKKRIVAMLLVTTLVLSALVGCKKSPDSMESGSTENSSTNKGSTDNGEGKQDYTFPLAEPVTFSMFAITNGTHELPDNITFQTIEKMTNVKWEVQSSLGADLAEKKGLLLASGNYPDVFFKAGFSGAELEKYGKQGVLLPLNDLIDEYAPNLKALIEERGIKDLLTSSDGNIYSLPELDDPGLAANPLWFNQAWLNKLGLEEPKNLDELYNVLKAFKEKDPNGNGLADEIPFTANVDATPIRLLLPYFTGIDYGTYSRIENNSLTYVPTSNEFKEYISYVHKLYSEGLMDKNSFTNTIEQQKALGASGDVLGAFFDAGAFLTVGRERDEDFKILTPFKEGVYPTHAGVSIGTLSITDACKNPELVMAWADRFYTEEGARLAWLGVEGETYKVNADGTWEWILGKHGDDIGTVRASGALQGAALHPSKSSQLWSDGITDPDEKYLNIERKRITDMGAPHFPNLRISDADAATIATIRADIDPYVEQFVAQVAVGEITLEDNWDTYLSTLEKMGLNDMMKIYQDAYAATIK